MSAQGRPSRADKPSIDEPGTRLIQIKAALSQPKTIWLRLEPSLEAEFAEDQRDSNIALARGGMLMAFMLNAVFLLLDYYWLGSHYRPDIQRLYWMFLLPMLLVAFALTGLSALRRHTTSITMLVLIAMGCAFAWTGHTVVLQADRPPYAFEACIIYIAFVYFFSGSQLRGAVIAAGSMQGVYLISLLLSPVTIQTTAYCMFFLLGIGGLGMMGRYLLERATRRDFLNRLLAQELAERDPLTGLYNRRVFSEQFETLSAVSRRQALPLTVLLLDIDHFKRVNDVCGHAFGDQVLRETGIALAAAVQRSGDCAARLGGDEFGAIWVSRDSAEAKLYADTLLQDVQVRCNRIKKNPGTLAPIGASVGLVTLVPGADAETLEQMLQRADEALYAAKRAGRGCVVSASTSPGA